MLTRKQIVYFIGIGGIGMSALARYFLLLGKKVTGYDSTPSDNTRMLEKLGAVVHFDETEVLISGICRQYQHDEILVVYTPAVSTNSPIIQWLIKNHIPFYKRSQVLGEICKQYKTIAVAGTHGKTTTSSLIAHILYQSSYSCTGFLGGIIKNYESNFLYHPKTNWVVVEADEYDRSFLTLQPVASVITAIDADHLDVYGTYDALKEAYQQYVNQLKSGGKLLLKKPIAYIPHVSQVDVATYSTEQHEKADCFLRNLKLTNGYFTFDIYTPWGEIKNITPGITGTYNVENVLAAASMALWLGIDKEQIRQAVQSFKGIRRRFDIQVHNSQHIYIDDYAHHPEEIKALLKSVKEVFPGKKIIAIFQPHLYSRTRDLADEFAAALDMADELALMDIYPARENPIEGVTSKLILDKMKSTSKTLLPDTELLNWVSERKPQLLITMGAGNIDRWVEPIKNLLNEA